MYVVAGPQSKRVGQTTQTIIIFRMRIELFKAFVTVVIAPTEDTGTVTIYPVHSSSVPIQHGKWQMATCQRSGFPQLVALSTQLAWGEGRSPFGRISSCRSDSSFNGWMDGSILQLS